MEQKEMIDLLRQVASGTMDVEQAALKLKEEPFEDLFRLILILLIQGFIHTSHSVPC